MITEANVQNLMRCVRNNENAPGFVLGSWIHPCGTYGCLVGNDVLACGSAADEWDDATSVYAFTESQYGICPSVTVFLFDSRELAYSNRGIHAIWGAGDRRNCTDKEAALNRLRKFIYYVLHKRELLYDDSGRIRETARRAEGNHNALAQVKAKVERACHDEPAYLAPDVAERAVFPNEVTYGN